MANVVYRGKSITFPGGMSEAEISQAMPSIADQIDADFAQAPQPESPKPQSFLSQVKDDIVKAITPNSKYKSVVDGMDGKVIDDRRAIERKGAPVTDQTFNKVKSSYENATPQKRAELSNRKDWLGNVASEVDKQYQEIKEDGIGDNRKEAKINKVMKNSNADFNTAKNMVEQGEDGNDIATIANGLPQREVVDYALDTVRAVAKIAPTTGKMATDILGLGTNYIPVVGDMIMSMGEGFDDAIKYQTDKQSPELRQKSIELQNIVKNGTGIQLTEFLTANPSVLSDVAIPSLGFMLASGGVGAGVTKLASEKAAANLTAKYAGRNAESIKTLAARYGREKGTQAAIAMNVGVNAGGAFSEAEGDARTKYTAAAIAGITTLLGNKITKGGAEGVIARGNSGVSSSVNRLANAAKTAGKESLQEYVEGGGQGLGVQTGEYAFGNREEIDFGQINRQGLLEAAAAGVPGAVVGALQGAGSFKQVTSNVRVDGNTQGDIDAETLQVEFDAKQAEADTALANITNPDASIDDAIALAEKAIDIPVPQTGLLNSISDDALLAEVQSATEAIPASDILGDENVSDTTNATTELANETITGSSDNIQGSLGDLPNQLAGRSDTGPIDNSTEASAQGSGSDQLNGNGIQGNDAIAILNGEDAVSRPFAQATDDFLPKMRSMTTDAKVISQIDEELKLRGITNVDSVNTTAERVDEKVKGVHVGEKINKEWTAFSPESGTLNIPRSEMPQVKAEHRGAMVNFLNARGVDHTQETVPASSLKPTQQEFSEAKVKKASKYAGGDRSILVSSDNHVLDGHHQWLSKLNKGGDVDVIRLNAPIAQLLDDVKEFPSSTVESGATTSKVQKPKSPKQYKPKTLLATLRDIGGIKLSEKQDVTGEVKGFAPGGYNQVFKQASNRSLKGLIESGDLVDYLPYNMRLESNGANDDAFDSTEAYDYLSEKIRNGESVLPYAVVEEAQANQYYQDAGATAESDVQEAAELLTEDEINEQLRQATNEERETATEARVINTERENGDTGSGERSTTTTQTNASQQAEVTDSKTDLLGDNTTAKQAVADAERAKDAKRNSGNDNQDTFTLTGSNSEADQAAAAGAQDLFSAPIKQQSNTEASTGEDVAENTANQSSNGQANDEVAKAAEALTAAGVKGKEKLDTIKDVREGKVTADEVADAYGAPNEAAEEDVADQAPVGRIDDFGEKLEGAKKDLWKNYQKAMGDELPADAKDITLSKHFPEPDYDNLIASGMDIKAIAAIKAMRDEIPSKPKMPSKVRRWVSELTALREFSNGLINGSKSIDDVLGILSASNVNNKFADRINLYGEIGYPAFKSAKGYKITGGWTSFDKGVAEAGKKTALEFPNGKREYFNDRQSAVDALRIKLEVAPEGTERKTKLDVYRVTATGDLVIGKKVASNKYIDLKGGFKSPKEAFQYYADNEAELLQLLEQRKNVRPERRSTNNPRVGIDYRLGQDVTPEKFAAEFGFRGVQFGNYVEQSRRPRDLNNAYDALLDLANIIGVPPRAISLNGTLGLAFGARGKGGKNPAAAHFERGEVVINLTKVNGFGSLGHEWFHAMDNYFSKARGDNEYLTQKPQQKRTYKAGQGFELDESIRPEVLSAFKNLMDAIRKSDYYTRSSKIDNTRTNDYWSTAEELAARAFEAYLIAKSKDAGRSNDYLANIEDEDVYEIANQAAKDFGAFEDPYPYPTRAEQAEINPLFDALFGELKTKETDSGNVVMFSRSNATPYRGMDKEKAQSIIDELQKSHKGIPKVKLVDHHSKLPIPSSIIEEINGSEQLLIERLELVTQLPSEQNIQAALSVRINDVEGLYSNGEIWINTNAINSEERLREVFAHEAIGHMSVESMLNEVDKTLFPKLLTQVKTLNKAGNKYIRGIWDDVKQSQPDIDDTAMAGEVLAFIAERGDQDVEMSPVVRSIWQRLIDGIKAFAKLVFNVEMTDVDVRDIVSMASRYAKGEDVVSLISSNNMYYSRNNRVPSKAEGDTFLTAALEFTARNEDFFENAPSDAKDIADIASDMNTQFRVEPFGKSQTKLDGADTAWEVFLPNAKYRSAVIYEKGNEVWINVSRLRSGADIGSRIYSLAAAYAYNNDKVFIGDPLGLTAKAFYRRAENMLSSALKYGTTKHIAPHVAQTDPDLYYSFDEKTKEFGESVRKINWKTGDDAHNIKELIYTVYHGAITNLPELKNVIFDPTTQDFTTINGEQFTNDDFERVLSDYYARTDGDSGSRIVDGSSQDATVNATETSNPYRAGIRTAKRAAFYNTFLREKSRERRSEILGTYVRELQNRGLADSLRGTFYSRSTPQTETPQFKAWFGNNGDFNPTNPDIRFSRTSSQGNLNNEIPAETTAQKIQRIGQDKFNRFKVLQDFLVEKGLELDEAADVYLAETLMSGRISTRKEDFREGQVEPLIKRTQAADLSMEQIGDFLKAQHAPEANKRARQLQNREDATAFGVSDAEAQDAMDAFKELPNFVELKSIANDWRKITEQTKKIKIDSGLLTPELVAAWESAYEMYVPVKGGDDAGTTTGTGQGLNVRVRNKQRLGHGLRDEAIIENILRDHESAITLDEKNRVGKALIRFALAAKNDDIITIDKPVKRQVLKQGETAYVVANKGIDTATFATRKEAELYIQSQVAFGQTKSNFSVDQTKDPVRVMLQASPQLADNEVTVYVGGHAIRLQINDEIAAREYKNMGVEHLNAIFSAGREVNNWLSKAYTGYSPDFIFTNPIRDSIQGAITLTGNLGGVTTAKIFANYPTAVKELVKHFKNKGSSALVNEYRAQGGSTGGAYLSDLERIGNDIQSSYNEYQGALATYKSVYEKNIANGKSAKAAHTMASLKAGSAGFKKIPIIGHFLKLMESINAITENALRVATYKTLTENGISKGRSAAQAKNLMNFNRKGEQSNAAGALYLFFNPAVQGTKLIQEALMESPYKRQAQALAGGMTAMAFTMAMMALNGDDEDKDKWNKTPDYIKDGNIVFDMFGTQFTLTLPYGYRVFWSLGNVMADATQDGANYGKLGNRVASSLFANFSPVGNPMEGENGLFQLLPTLPKMALAPGVNEDSFGRPITPKKWNPATPDSQLMNRGTQGSLYDGVSEKLNSFTGGSNFKSGVVDVSPETLKFWVKSLTGGAGQFAFDSANIVKQGAQGVSPQNLKDIPIARKFARETGVTDSRSAFWERKNEADMAADQLALAKKAHDTAAIADFINENGMLIKMSKMSDRMLKMANGKRDAIGAIKLNENLTLSEKIKMINELEDEEKKIYDKYINIFDKQSN